MKTLLNVDDSKEIFDYLRTKMYIPEFATKITLELGVSELPRLTVISYARKPENDNNSLQE